MTRNELIEKLESILYSQGICVGSECNVGEVADFILANFVPKGEKMYEGKLVVGIGGTPFIITDDEEEYSREAVTIFRKHRGKQAILIIKDEE